QGSDGTDHGRARPRTRLPIDRTALCRIDRRAHRRRCGRRFARLPWRCRTGDGHAHADACRQDRPRQDDPRVCEPARCGGADGAMSGTWLVIPGKGLEEGKSRLAPVLPTVVRQRLVKAMLADVLAAASAAAGVAGRLLVTPDRRIAAQGEREGAAVLLEPRARGLNRAAGRGIARARALGAAGVVVVPGDVPLTEAHDIEQVVRAIAGGQRRVAIVPSADGLGTNALAETPPGVLAPSFGPDSFQRHRAAAL